VAVGDEVGVGAGAVEVEVDVGAAASAEYVAGCEPLLSDVMDLGREGNNKGRTFQWIAWAKRSIPCLSREASSQMGNIMSLAWPALLRSIYASSQHTI
jgi:hypothetical protein